MAEMTHDEFWALANNAGRAQYMKGAEPQQAAAIQPAPETVRVYETDEICHMLCADGFDRSKTYRVHLCGGVSRDFRPDAPAGSRWSDPIDQTPTNTVTITDAAPMAGKVEYKDAETYALAGAMTYHRGFFNVVCGGGGGGGGPGDKLDDEDEEDAAAVDLFFKGTLHADERERILTGMESFRESEDCSRRDWMIEARGANKMLDRLKAWIAGGAQKYEPKD